MWQQELATRGLSPMGDKAEMVKLLVDFLKSQKATIAAPASAPEATTAGALDAVDVAKKVCNEHQSLSACKLVPGLGQQN